MTLRFIEVLFLFSYVVASLENSLFFFYVRRAGELGVPRSPMLTEVECVRVITSFDIVTIATRETDGRGSRGFWKKKRETSYSQFRSTKKVQSFSI